MERLYFLAVPDWSKGVIMGGGQGGSYRRLGLSTVPQVEMKRDRPSYRGHAVQGDEAGIGDDLDEAARLSLHAESDGLHNNVLHVICWR